MALRVRKQIYLEKRQAATLRRQARKFGLTEAELIRRAIDQHVLASRPRNPDAWKKERAYIQRLIAQGPVPGQRKWRREDLYDRC